MKIIFTGELPEKSSPILTWMKSLERVGVESVFADLYNINAVSWLRLLIQSDAVIFQGYGVTSNQITKKLALATILFKPVIRKWSGTDVLNCNERDYVRNNVLSLDGIIALNLTTEHVGLVNELEAIGLKVILAPQVISSIGVPSLDFTCKIPKKVLIYLPHKRKLFYGMETIEKVIKLNPRVNFIIVADNEHSLEKYENVSSLGWIEDMSAVWDEVGLLIRITKHDGYARSIVEALSRGKYVIHNNKIPGSWYAQTESEITHEIQKFLKMDELNKEGFKCVAPSIDGRSDTILEKELKLAKVTFRSWYLAVIKFVQSFKH